MTVADLLGRLATDGPVQRAAIISAIKNGGFVSRDEVYTIGGFSPSRTLRGFTRPARRVMQGMQDDGALSDNAEEPLETIYDPKTAMSRHPDFACPWRLLMRYGSHSPQPPKEHHRRHRTRRTTF